MFKIKSISKRAIALLLAILTMLSCGIISAVAANVDLVPTGGYNLNCKFVYDNSKTKWSSIQLFVGHSSYSRGYMMTRIANTDLYQVSVSGWGDATQIAIFTESSEWGGEDHNISHRFGYTSKPKSSVLDLGGNMGDGVQLIKPSSGSSGCTLSTEYFSDYNGLNTNQTAAVYAKALGSTSYSANSAAGTVSVSSYRVNSSWGSTATSGNPALAARTATVTMTAQAKDGYKFVGWYSSTSATTAETTSTTLTYTCTGSAKTYYARFDKEVTATFKDYNGTILGTDTVAPGETPTAPADPTREGYTFAGWNPEIGPINENTTYEATYTQDGTIKIYLDYGANKHYQKNGAATDVTIGHTTLNTDEEGVHGLSELKYCSQNGDHYYDTGYMSATVAEGVPVTIQCTIQSNATEYMVDGFVIDGKEFVTANYMGNNLYTATYAFTKAGTVVVPIYSYTDAFLEAEGLTEITLYAQKPDDFKGDWGDYMAAYVWYDDPNSTNKNTTDYIFGSWPGQIMIPVAGTENYWYTTVTSKSANDYPASGITFSNYGGWENTTGVLYPVTNTTNIQVFDYYEFITLAQQEVDNITFVLKNGDSDNGGGSGVQISDSAFTNYVNISHETIDIYGDEIADDAAIGLYVIRNAPVSSTTSPLSGYYYVQCSLYQANGTYIGQCFSYELLDIEALATRLGNSYLRGLKGKRVRVDYETMIHSENGDGNSAKRYDGQWYNAVVEVELKVNVAVTTDNGATYTVTNSSPANTDTYGSALVGGGEVSVVERGDTVALAATPAAGYKFVGWYTSNGTKISSATTTSVNAVIDSTYTAVFQALGEGEFVVTHEIYHGGGSSAYVPDAHGGRADLYVGIENKRTGEKFAFTKTGMGSVTATEGDELTITIGTDPLGVDRFFSWYIDAVDKYGLTTYEEVGVDNYDGSELYGNLYNNGVDTIEGSSQLVYFQFTYIVKPDIFNITLYSDVIPTSANAKLVYKYENRYGEVKSVTVPYTLTLEEIEGCDGNGGKPMTPTQKTIYDNAPYVEDFYKDSTWKITDALYNELLFELWATQPDTVYTVTINAGGSTSYKSGKFNTEVEVNARDNNPNLTNSGFWYIDANRNYAYDEGDSVLSYGVYYGLRITDDMMIGYQTVDSLDFDVLLGAPEYGREQNTDSSGGNATDFIYIDYIESFLVPYFNGNTTDNGNKIDGVYYNDELIPTANTSVTLETLEKLDYSFDYGLIMEQLKPDIVDTAWGKVAADESILKEVAAGATGFVDKTNSSKYYTMQSAKSNFFLTNKNRLLFTIKMDNNEDNQKKYYNVYGYLSVTDTKTNTTKYYFSNMQTLNILDIGNNKGNEQAPDASN